MKALYERDKGKLDKERDDQFDKLSDMMIKGGKEMGKQRLFKCRIDKIEFEMRYQTSRIKEIKDEMEELREDSDDAEEKLETLSQLKKELKVVQKAKKDAYQNWKVATDAEEGRRTLLDMNDSIEESTISLSTHFEQNEYSDSPSTLSASVQSETKSSDNEALNK